MIVEERWKDFWTWVRLPSSPLVFIRRDPPKVGGIRMKHAGTWEQSLPFNAFATLKLSKSNSVYDIIIHRNMFCLVYQRKKTASYVAEVIYSAVIFMV